MKLMIFSILSVLFSFNVIASEPVKEVNQKTVKKKISDSKKIAKTADAPCADSKEDLLKKIEAEKKAKEEAGKGFSLQGSKDTGCSIK